MSISWALLFKPKKVKNSIEDRMAQSLADIILHLVFSTKERRPWICSEDENVLYRYMGGVSNDLNCPIIKINGMADHIHLLFQLGRTIAVSKFVSEVKSSSSRWLKTKGNHYQDFSWQDGYGIFSVSRVNLEGAKNYLASQKEHHKIVTFKDELLSLLKRAQIPYDEKYLWD